jgi:hypothetical protein
MQEESDREVTETLVKAARRVSRRKFTPEFLAEVAEVYRANIDDSPIKAIAARYHVEYRQAAKYVEQARSDGHLPQTTRGKRQA